MKWLIYFGTDQEKVRIELEIEVINVYICNCKKSMHQLNIAMSGFYSILILEYIDDIACKLYISINKWFCPSIFSQFSNNKSKTENK